jgi:DNA polymerase-3 subunit delta'
MSFENVLDQSTAVRTLRAAIDKGRVAHAYLFVGPSGVGRKLTASILARSLNCEKPNGAEPCEECATCRLISQDKHPDIRTIEPTKRSSTIGVEQVEELLPFAYMKPVKGKIKVFILSEADRLGVQAANKLLKTLEEPPPATVFVLVTERPESVLPTVTSRCQPVKFGKLRTESVARILETRFGVDRTRAAFAAELADGQVTRGLQFAEPKRLETLIGVVESLERFSARLHAYDRLVEFLQEEQSSLTEQAERKISVEVEAMTPAMKSSLEDRRKSFVDRHFREFLNDCLGVLLTFYRDLYVLKETGDEHLVINRNRLDLLRKQAKKISGAAILENVGVLEETSKYFSHYVGEDRAFLDLVLRLRDA